MTIVSYQEFIKPIDLLYKKKASVILGYLKSPITQKLWEVKYKYPYGVIVPFHTCNGDSLEAYYFIKDYTDPIYGYSWQLDKRVYAMKRDIKKGEHYVIDSKNYEDPTYNTWLEKIDLKNDGILYTENYVLINSKDVNFLILDGTILNY